MASLCGDIGDVIVDTLQSCVTEIRNITKIQRGLNITIAENDQPLTNVSPGSGFPKRVVIQSEHPAHVSKFVSLLCRLFKEISPSAKSTQCYRSLIVFMDHAANKTKIVVNNDTVVRKTIPLIAKAMLRTVREVDGARHLFLAMKCDKVTSDRVSQFVSQSLDELSKLSACSTSVTGKRDAAEPGPSVVPAPAPAPIFFPCAKRGRVAKSTESEASPHVDVVADRVSKTSVMCSIEPVFVDGQCRVETYHCVKIVGPGFATLDTVRSTVAALQRTTLTTCAVSESIESVAVVRGHGVLFISDGVLSVGKCLDAWFLPATKDTPLLVVLVIPFIGLRVAAEKEFHCLAGAGVDAFVALAELVSVARTPTHISAAGALKISPGQIVAFFDMDHVRAELHIDPNFHRVRSALPFEINGEALRTELAFASKRIVSVPSLRVSQNAVLERSLIVRQCRKEEEFTTVAPQWSVTLDHSILPFLAASKSGWIDAKFCPWKVCPGQWIRAGDVVAIAESPDLSRVSMHVIERIMPAVGATKSASLLVKVFRLQPLRSAVQTDLGIDSSMALDAALARIGDAVGGQVPAHVRVGNVLTTSVHCIVGVFSQEPDGDFMIDSHPQLRLVPASSASEGTALITFKGTALDLHETAKRTVVSISSSSGTESDGSDRSGLDQLAIAADAVEGNSGDDAQIASCGTAVVHASSAQSPGFLAKFDSMFSVLEPAIVTWVKSNPDSVLEWGLRGFPRTGLANKGMSHDFRKLFLPIPRPNASDSSFDSIILDILSSLFLQSRLPDQPVDMIRHIRPFLVHGSAASVVFGDLPFSGEILLSDLPRVTEASVKDGDLRMSFPSIPTLDAVPRCPACGDPLRSTQGNSCMVILVHSHLFRGIDPDSTETIRASSCRARVGASGPTRPGIIFVHKRCNALIHTIVETFVVTGPVLNHVRASQWDQASHGEVRPTKNAKEQHMGRSTTIGNIVANGTTLTILRRLSKNCIPPHFASFSNFLAVAPKKCVVENRIFASLFFACILRRVEEGARVGEVGAIADVLRYTKLVAIGLWRRTSCVPPTT